MTPVPHPLRIDTGPVDDAPGGTAVIPVERAVLMGTVCEALASYLERQTSERWARVVAASRAEREGR